MKTTSHTRTHHLQIFRHLLDRTIILHDSLNDQRKQYRQSPDRPIAQELSNPREIKSLAEQVKTILGSTSSTKGENQDGLFEDAFPTKIVLPLGNSG